MPTIESIKKDIHSLGYAEKEEILNYLEEVITFGAASNEITENIKDPDFPREKSVRIVLMKMYQDMVNTKTSKDISANHARKHLQILPCHQSIIAGMM